MLAAPTHRLLQFGARAQADHVEGPLLLHEINDLLRALPLLGRESGDHPLRVLGHQTAFLPLRTGAAQGRGVAQGRGGLPFTLELAHHAASLIPSNPRNTNDGII